MSRYVDVEPLDVAGTKGVSKDYVDGMAYVLDLLDNLLLTLTALKYCELHYLVKDSKHGTVL